MRYHVTLGGRTLEVEVGADGVWVDGTPVEADLRRLGTTGVHGLLLDGASHRLLARMRASGSWELHVDGRPVTAEVVDERTRAIREMTGAGAGAGGPRPLKAPMPGMVVKVEVAEGDEVVEGQGLVIVEAMKMENELIAEGPARVVRVLVEPGQAVEKDQVLIDLAPPGSGGADDGGGP